MKLSDLNLLELDNSLLEASKFYSAYSSLPFNKGIVFKRIGTQPQFLLEDYTRNLNKNVYELTVQNTSEVKQIGANIQVHNFIFDILTHKDIEKKWRYNDDDFFTELSDEFNSYQSFQKIGLFEITNEDFFSRLLGWSLMGSCYGNMDNYSEQEIREMIDSFISKLLTDPNDRIIVTTQPWGQYLIGWFECFFIVRKTDIVILGKDDYD